jgi:hypothetical protein
LFFIYKKINYAHFTPSKGKNTGSIDKRGALSRMVLIIISGLHGDENENCFHMVDVFYKYAIKKEKKP